MGSTPVYGFPFPEGSDLPDGPAQIEALAAALEAKIAGGIGTAELTALAITTAKIADLAVTTAKLADDAVTAAKIAANAVGSSEIAADAVGASEIAANAVGSSELADNAVTAQKIATDAVGSSELADNAVDTGAIADGAVTSNKMFISRAGDTQSSSILSSQSLPGISLSPAAGTYVAIATAQLLTLGSPNGSGSIAVVVSATVVATGPLASVISAGYSDVQPLIVQALPIVVGSGQAVTLYGTINGTAAISDGRLSLIRLD